MFFDLMVFYCVCMCVCVVCAGLPRTTILKEKE